MNIIVIGGSGGIGGAIVEACCNHYPKANIYATYCLNPPIMIENDVKWIKVNLHSEDEIQKFAASFDSVNILINAAGILHSNNVMPEKSLNEFDSDFFTQNIMTNTLPTILLAKHFFNALKSNQLQANMVNHFIVISAKIGSIDDNKSGGWLSYRTSKAALNMAVKTLSIEWQRRLPHCCVTLFHPGTTDTNLSKPFQKRLPKDQLHSSGYTAIALLKLMKTLTPNESGGFYSYDGTALPW